MFEGHCQILYVNIIFIYFINIQGTYTGVWFTGNCNLTYRLVFFPKCSKENVTWVWLVAGCTAVYITKSDIIIFRINSGDVDYAFTLTEAL